jgi:hypothetical protein
MAMPAISVVGEKGLLKLLSQQPQQHHSKQLNKIIIIIPNSPNNIS